LQKWRSQHPQLHIHTSYSDRFVDLIAEGFDCAIRSAYLQDSNLIAKRVGPINGKLVASPDYIKAHGSPETVEQLADHQALMQGTEAWQFMDGDKIVTVSRRAGSRPTTPRRLPPRPRQVSASPGSPIASHTTMLPPARSSP
jgi:DNA-binding transcriptional LysR family regulator